MLDRLLDRQISLIEYLCSNAVLFGEEITAPVDPALRGLDPGVLRLLARFACNKRLETILAVFPRTLEILGADQKLILREFAEATRPSARTRSSIARQFAHLLSARSRCAPSVPAYLLDVAACELAIVEANEVISEQTSKMGNSNKPKPGVRRRSSVVSLRCAHDIQSIFMGGSPDVVPPKRDTSLVVTFPTGCCDPKIFEITPIVFDLLAQLQDWVDPRQLGAMGCSQDLFDRLAADDLIEVHI